jgi:uncharacterized membrane protein YhhN
MLLPAILTGAGLALLLVSEWQGLLVLRALSKTAAAAGFVWGGCLAVGPNPSLVGAAMLVGFGLSAVGDLCLLARKPPVFLAGLLTFLVAHIAYTIAFLQLGLEGWVIGAGLVGSGAVGVVVWRWLEQHVSGHMRAAVAVYIVAIATMLGCAIFAGHGSGSGWLVAGAACFVVSDISVARDRFVKRGRINLMWGPPLYFGAQWMFILGLLAD